MLRRAIPEHEVADRVFNLRGAGEERLDVRLGAPQQRRCEPGRRRDVTPHRAEEISDEPSRRPRRDADASAGAHQARVRDDPSGLRLRGAGGDMLVPWSSTGATPALLPPRPH